MNTPDLGKLRASPRACLTQWGATAVAAALIATLTACGGDTAPAFSKGTFIDDPVAGLTYACVGGARPVTGVTDSAGQFDYLPGQSCTFSVGKVTLGTLAGIPADGKVTPQDVAGVTRSATSAPSAVAIAQFLHSLNDGSTSGRIVIPVATRDALNTSAVSEVTLASSSGVVSQATLQALVANVPGATLASAATATAALDTQISQGNVSTSSGAVSASAPVVLNSIVVTSAASSQAAGLAAQLTATGYYSDGSHADLSGTVTWASSDAQALRVDAAGLATGLRTGNATVTASLQPSGASSAVSGSFVQTTTAAVLQSIAVTHTASPVAGRTDQLTATGSYSDGTTADLTASVRWASSDSNTVTLSDSTAGLATGVAEGSASITATYTPAGGTLITSPAFTETVLAPTITNLVISYVQSGLTSIQNGATAALQAVASWTNNTTQTVSSLVTWAVNAISGGASIVVDAVANAAATLTGTAVGDVGISASYQGANSNSLTLSVTPVIRGTVSQGAPLDSGTVTIMDSRGQTVASNVRINADGTYEAPPFDAANFTPPYIITATGQVFDGTATHVALVNQAGTANVTPLSTLMVAGLTGGNVYKLTDASVVQGLSSSLTTANVNTKTTELQTLVGSFASALGFSGDPVTSSYNNALDKVLDNLAIDVKPSGAATVLPQSAQRGDDETNAAPTRPVAATGLGSAALTAPSTNSRSFSVKDAEMTAFMAKLNDCLAAAQASRSTACAGIALASGEDTNNSASVYLNDGKDALTDFAALFSAGAGSGWEPGASVATPQIMRQIDDTKLDVKFPIVGTAASGNQRNTIVSTLKLVTTSSGQQFRLYGNQRKFGVSITASALKVATTQSNGDPVVSYEPSLNIRVGPIAYTENGVTTTLGAARICGPGLPGYVNDANPCGANGGVWMADAGLPVYAGSGSYDVNKRCSSGLTMVPFRVYSSVSNDSTNVLFSPEAGAQTFTASTTGSDNVSRPNYAPSSGLNCLSNFRLAQVDGAGAASVNTTGKGQSAAAYLRNYGGSTSTIDQLQAGDAYRVYLYGSSATSSLSAARQQTAISTPNGQGYYTVRLRSRPLSVAEITSAPFAVFDPALVSGFQSFKTNGPVLSSGKLPVSWTYQPGATRVNAVTLQYNNGGDLCGTRFSPLSPPAVFPANYVRSCADFSTAAVWSSGKNNISLQGTDAFGVLYITRLQ